MLSTWGRLTLAAALALTGAAASADPETLTLSGHKDVVNALAFSPDGKQLATASDDTSVRIWDVESGTEQKKINVHEKHVMSVAWTTDGRYVMSGGDDGHIKLTDSRGREIRDLKFKEPVHSIAVCADGSVVAFGLKDGSVRIVDATTWSVTKEIENGSSVESMAFSSDGAMLAVGDSNAMVNIFDPQSGKKMRRSPGHTDEVRCVSFNRDGTLIASGSNDHTIRIWDAASGKALRTMLDHADVVFGVTFSPDGSRLASVGGDETVRIWDPSTGKEKSSWEAGHSGRICCLGYRPDGKVIATGGADCKVVLWFLEPTRVKEPPKPPPPPPPPPEPPKPDLKKITRTQVDALATSLKSFEADLGYLPHSVNTGMVNALSNAKRGGYYRFDKAELNKFGEVVDAWGNALSYRSPGSKGAKFDLYSFGPNGKDEGGAGDDIGNW